jgi:type VI secretion system protein ImpE
MNSADAAALSLKNGDPAAALALLQEQVRARPADAALRIFLFQLLCVRGQWERALNQLKVATELDASALAMAQMYGEAVRCEAIRRDVFNGRKAPMVFGEPEQWLALLIESLLVAGRGEATRASELRLRAFEEADTSSGQINGQPFEWVADADSRLGPVLEAVMNGRYYWIPFSRLSAVTIEAPEDLRDIVWMPAHLRFENGGEMVSLIPTRYPDSESSEDGQIVLARKTVWQEVAADTYHGLGQRIITTDAVDVPLMELRTLTVGAASAAPAGA